MIDRQLSEAINIAAMCKDGSWPVPGGLLDQSAWFIRLKQQLENDEARLQAEAMETK